MRGDRIHLPGGRHVPVGRRARHRRSANHGMSGRAIPAAGVLTLGAAALAGLLAPWIAPHDPNTRYPDLLNAPPTRVYVVDGGGAWRRPHIHRWTRVSQLE